MSLRQQTTRSGHSPFQKAAVGDRGAGDVAAQRQYRVGTANFSAILQYNRSYFYASAVVEFARAIASAAEVGEKSPSPVSSRAAR